MYFILCEKKRKYCDDIVILVMVIVAAKMGDSERGDLNCSDGEGDSDYSEGDISHARGYGDTSDSDDALIV